MALTLAERDKKVVWHPYTPQKYMADPIPVAKGDGAYLIDVNGNKYLDAISSWWVTIHGHAHPYIAEKLYEQAKTLEQVIFAGFTHEPAVQLAERLLGFLPGPFSRIFYSDNGSTATEVAIKMAIQYWWNKGEQKRTKILAFTNAYHGDTFGAMSVSGRSVFTMAFRDKLFEVIFVDVPESGVDSRESIVETTKSEPRPPTSDFRPQTSDLPWNEIACFIYEPLLQGAGGMKIYDAAGMNRLLQQCRQHKVICIADEVMTGFGRTGKWFASAYMEEKPDIICLSKGLTGGTMALGVTACTQKIYDAFVDDDKTKTFFHGHSFTANPLACATALASLDLLQKESCRQQVDMIVSEHATFLQRLRAIDSRLQAEDSRLPTPDYRLLTGLRQLGTIIAFEINTGNSGYLNNIGVTITQKALSKGVYLRPLGNTVYLMPPYCITKEQLQQVYTTLIEIIEELSANF
jgi:adenosylmethionine-8-amino-7-oxononanoate aminotransferase